MHLRRENLTLVAVVVVNIKDNVSAMLISRTNSFHQKISSTSCSLVKNQRIDSREVTTSSIITNIGNNKLVVVMPMKVNLCFANLVHSFFSS